MSARSTTQNYRQKQPQHGGGLNNQAHMKFVPKAQKQQIPLTTSLRETTNTDSTCRVRIGESGNWISNRNQGGNFVNYLPQDEAVATGHGGEDGALDPVESQRVVDILNRELARLLKLNPRDFWREVAGDTSLHDFLDSFLQFRKRWYDFPHHGANGGLVAGVIVGELDLSRRVFMVLYRISSNRDPGARASDSLSAKEHGALLQGKRLLDLPKLLDICAVYGHENEELVRLLVTNAMQAQPMLHENLSAVVSRFLSVVQTMHQRCDSLLETFSSSKDHDDPGDGQLHADFLEVMDFINDAIASLGAFVDAYKLAALYFSCPVEMSYGSGELLGTLARLHDSLLPCLKQGLEQKFQNSGGGTHPDTASSFKILSMRIFSFFWKLLDFCYLGHDMFEGSLPLLTATKMFPFTVEDPMIRGDILVQTFREISEEVSRHDKGNKGTGTLLQKVQNMYKVLSRLDELRDSGWLFLDTDQYQFITLLVMPPFEAMKKEFNRPSSMGNKVQVDENAAITESKISQIKDIFPDYGKGYLAACLEAYNQNPEEVIQRILEGTLHEELQSMDSSLEKIPPPKSASSSSKSDKGKGLVQDTQPSEIVDTRERKTEGTSSSSAPSPSVGRYTRKTKIDQPNLKTLDSRSGMDSTKTAFLASQYEYEDEYDDSFDDLGLSVVETGYEEAENMGERVKSAPGKPSASETENATANRSGARWNSRKTPQFYVKDGKNYSYKVSGSVAVADSREAALVNQVQTEVINGLGRGGNLPLGAVKAWKESNHQHDESFVDTEKGGRGNPTSSRGRGRKSTNGFGRGGDLSLGAVKARGGSNDQQDESNGDTEIGGRGNPTSSRGRGRRGGGRNHNRKDLAMKKSFAGLGGL